MIGIKGQTKEMIDKDIEIILNTFEKADSECFYK